MTAGFLGTFLDSVARAPGQAAVIHSRYSPGGDVEEVATYANLDRSARRFAAWLRQHCEPGDRTLLLYPQGLEFVRAFLGCLYAGVAPVVTPSPDGSRRRLERTAELARDSGARLALTGTASSASLKDWLATAGFGHVLVAATDGAGTFDDADPTFADADPRGWPGLIPEPSSTAFLQYTSGSTSTPRGVVVSHGNLEHNLRTSIDGFALDSDMATCSWLPMFHDMGLIMTLLTPLYLGATTVLLSPQEFLRRPYRWLQLISRHGAAFSAAPNFGYDLCARLVTDEQLAGVDLSGWHVAVNGAEPIDPSTLERFAGRFAPMGFRAEAFAPGYGLAENTLVASGNRGPVARMVDTGALSRSQLVPASPRAPATTIVSSGRVIGSEIRIVDPRTRRQLPDGEIGEIWVRGASVTQGYWGKPADTAATFHACTDEGEGPFLRTGDLGALDGQWVYVTGRLKDMMIIHGRNLYPHDVEQQVRSVDPAFADRHGAAFSVQGRQKEEVVVVQELRGPGLDEVTLRDLANRIEAGLHESFGVHVGNVVFVRPGQICRTTSGKLQRNRTRALFQSNDLQVLYETLTPAVRDRYRPAARQLPTGSIKG
jgi:acyl-CoA synthetase (AMP-forming)/AMP-acid ligase II